MNKGMDAVGILVLCLSSSLCLYFLLALIRGLHKLWWVPISIQHQMGSQGIRGPPYRFIRGNTKEILNLQKEAMSRPMDLSHEILPIVYPHINLWVNTYGKIFLQWVGPRAELVVTDPELIKDILNNKDNAYPKQKPQAYVKKLLGDGLVTSEGEKWAKMRKLANFAFHAERLKNMIPAMITSTEMMLERWKQHERKEVEVFEEFTELTSEVISRTAFGSSYMEGKSIFQMLTKLGEMTSRNVYKFRIPVISKIYKTDDEVESEKLEKGLRNSIVEIIKKREEEVMAGEVGSFGDDFLGLLVKAHHDPDANQRISVEDLVDECKTFYVAGQETTKTLLAWTVFLLALHTDWQDEARREVLNLFGQQNPTPDGISKLKIMNMIINESFRLYPPVLSIVRKVDRRVGLGKLTLPADLALRIPTLALHHDPQIWGEDVHLFKPERFSEGLVKATGNNQAAYLPFGMGPRNCVGSNFASIEAKVALSMILQRFAFRLSPAYVHSPTQVLTVLPRHGIQVILQSL